jgi:hypothetical protein
MSNVRLPYSRLGPEHGQFSLLYCRIVGSQRREHKLPDQSAQARRFFVNVCIWKRRITKFTFKRRFATRWVYPAAFRELKLTATFTMSLRDKFAAECNL